jgi:hypothetical protein
VPRHRDKLRSYDRCQWILVRRTIDKQDLAYRIQLSCLIGDISAAIGEYGHIDFDIGQLAGTCHALRGTEVQG